MSWLVSRVRLILAASLVLAEWMGSAQGVAEVFIPERLEAIDGAIRRAIAEKKCPGGVLWLERHGVAYSQAFGQRAVVPAAESMTLDTIFDAASLTKVIATAPAVAKLIETGRLRLDAPVSSYLPEFHGADKERITVRQLLTHTSGLRSGLGARGEWKGTARALQLACEETLKHPPGTQFLYSDINFIVLGELVHRVSGRRLDRYCTEELFEPLQMRDTQFLPEARVADRVAPTERLADGTVLRAVVHDPTARRMGGVAGHAGLFTTAGDLARFSRMLLNGGELEGRRVLQSETVRLMTSVQTPEAMAARRGLGWDIDSPYAGPRGQWFPIGSYGHTGWTGTSMWVDPFSKTFVFFLSNRNHPGDEGTVLTLRRTLGTLAAEAIRGFDWKNVPGALPSRTSAVGAETAPTAASPSSVLNGIDVLARDGFKPLRGKKVGLITNHTGIDRERRSTIDLLHGAPEVSLVALFSPEHGIRGVLDEKVQDGRDEKTGLPIYSLYGESRAPTPEQLAGLDVLVYDLQDIGCRFYTYISTLGESMLAASAAQKAFLVLDRVNPITGTHVEGPLLDGPRSFVGWHELPLRHGMTVGELARMFQRERGIRLELTVIPCEGWSRGQWFDATGLPWINTSPNMRSLTQAILYPGVGLIEMCPISVGRGTDTPFERIGAPYINDLRLAEALNAAALPGVRFVPIRFTPTVNKFKGLDCGGVQILLTDREMFRATDLGVTLARVIHRLYPEQFDLDKVGTLLMHAKTLESIRNHRELAGIHQEWEGAMAQFLQRRALVSLYK